MAKNAAWRGSLATWRGARRATGSDARTRRTCSRSTSSSICAASMATSPLRRRSGARASIARPARSRSPSCWPRRPGATAPALNWFGGFKTVNGRIDLQEIRPVRHRVDGARARDPSPCGGTRDTRAACRRQGARASGEADLDALIDAQATFLDLILAQQIRDIADGIPPSNTVEVGRLSRRERERLRGAFAGRRPSRHADAGLAVSRMNSASCRARNQSR